MIRLHRCSVTILTLGVLLAWGFPALAQDKSPDKEKAPDKKKEVQKEEKKDKVIPPWPKQIPETIEDLRLMEKQVQAVLERVSPSTVGVIVGPGQGSGVIVSADGLVLTAGHVSKNPGDDALIILSNGKQYKAKSLGRNGALDSGMIKITSGGPFPFVEMASNAKVKTGDWCIAVGHPGGFRPNRGLVTRVGRVLFNSNSLMRTDCALVGGDSGGPLFDMQGRVIGIHSRIGNKLITENIHVPIDTFHQTWDRLVKGEAWGGILGQSVLVPSAEGKTVLEEKGEITTKDPFDLKMKNSHHKIFKFKMVPGFAYTFDLVSSTFDAFLRLEDADGKMLAENDDGGGEQNSRIVYRPSRELEYRIVVTTFEPNQTGNFTFTIRQNEIVAKDLPGGKVDIFEALKLPRPMAAKVVSQLTKAGHSPYVNAQLFDESGKPIAQKEVTFVWKNGKSTAKTDDQGQARLKLSDDKIDALVVDVPEGLKVLVRITDEEGIPLPIRGLGKKK